MHRFMASFVSIKAQHYISSRHRDRAMCRSDNHGKATGRPAVFHLSVEFQTVKPGLHKFGFPKLGFHKLGFHKPGLVLVNSTELAPVGKQSAALKDPMTRVFCI